MKRSRKSLKYKKVTSLVTAFVLTMTMGSQGFVYGLTYSNKTGETVPKIIPPIFMLKSTVGNDILDFNFSDENEDIINDNNNEEDIDENEENGDEKDEDENAGNKDEGNEEDGEEENLEDINEVPELSMDPVPMADEDYSVTQLYASVRTIKGTGVAGQKGKVIVLNSSKNVLEEVEFDIESDGTWSAVIETRLRYEGGMRHYVNIEFYTDYDEDPVYSIIGAEIEGSKIYTPPAQSYVYAGPTGTLGMGTEGGAINTYIYAFEEEAEISVVYGARHGTDLGHYDDNDQAVDYREIVHDAAVFAMSNGGADNARAFARNNNNYDKQEMKSLDEAKSKNSYLTDSALDIYFTSKGGELDNVAYFLLTKEDIEENDFYISQFLFYFERVFSSAADKTYLFDSEGLFHGSVSMQPTSSSSIGSDAIKYGVKKPNMSLSLEQKFAVNGGELQDGNATVNPGDTVYFELLLQVKAILCWKMPI